MKSVYGLLLLMTLSSHILAKDYLEEDFNRLFTTAIERKNLDLAREQGRLFKKISKKVACETIGYHFTGRW